MMRGYGLIVRIEQYFHTSEGGRRLDGAIFKNEYDRNPIAGFETKTGNSPYHTAQQTKDKWIQENKGFPIFLIRKT